MRWSAITALAATSIASASWSQNLNYRSPSEHHPSLGISVHRVNRRNDANKYWDASKLNFTHGVASGDPYAHSVLLWTRVAPAYDSIDDNSTDSGYVPLYYHGPAQISTAPVCVDYKVAEDAELRDVVTSGRAFTSSDIDYTVKVEAKDLKPFTRYYYQFNVCGTDKKSTLGRTKTAPRVNDDVDKVGLAVYTCSNYPFGYFNAYGNSARKDNVDYVVHLGDYIYEYAGNGDYGDGRPISRVPQPERIIYTLFDYRERYNSYRNDADLALSHATHPWIAIWDDHEVSDNTYRDGASYLTNNEDSFVKDGGVSVDQRKMNAVRAYFEWMPIRTVEMDDNLRIWRTFAIGNLFDLIMLDTRQYDRSITDLYYNTDYVHQIANDAGRTMMGSRQENWFYNQLSASNDRGAIWRVIGSQTVFSKMNQSVVYGNVNPLDYDAWDGYQSNRNRTLKHLYDNEIDNNIVMAGDSHVNWAADLVWLDNEDYDSKTGEGAVGAEFAVTAVSSPSAFGKAISINAANNISDWLTAHNPELQWQEAYYRGYYELQLTPELARVEYFGMPTIVNRNPNEISLANFTLKAGGNEIQRPVAGGKVETGSLKNGQVSITNITHDTSTGKWFISHEDREVE
ncbi:hypothetical protein AMS68_002258 [Peltaster fructicola]|uniref:PhoD-like phosphatase metallophosphatase domain-containing protein n=1 Tax=Peltaster fructicola TaxID=286661 RepID=A0A6H0XQ13_9PEZI|nr:hypothetical protein AMS68_002258 [Peltaster fructicola]